MAETPHQFKMKGVATSDYAAVQAHIDELEKRPEALPEPHAFRIFGAEEHDFAKVQAHVDTLEEVVDTLDKGSREEFCKKLAEDGKVLASKLDDVLTYAKGLDRPAYDAWAKNWEFVPGSSMFENHGSSGGTDEGHKTGGEMKQSEIDQTVVDTYRRAGRDEEWIANTEAGKRLAAAAAAAK